MILSGGDIVSMLKQGLSIARPGGENAFVGPSSVDLHLGEQYLVPQSQKRPVVVDDEDSYPDYQTVPVDNYIIQPGGFVLATTEERIEIPPTLVGYLQGRSSVGRLGQFVENAGLIDAGFEGQVTLELFNAAPYPIQLKSGMRAVQISFHQHQNAPDVDYSTHNNKYQGQEGPTPSRLWEDFE